MADMDSSLDPCQFSNRKGRSASHYLVDLVQYILNEAEAGNYVNLLAVNYSKAFNRVDITIALQHLHRMNVCPELLPRIADFLSNREQCVRLGPNTSD